MSMCETWMIRTIHSPRFQSRFDHCFLQDMSPQRLRHNCGQRRSAFRKEIHCQFMHAYIVHYNNSYWLPTNSTNPAISTPSSLLHQARTDKVTVPCPRLGCEGPGWAGKNDNTLQYFTCFCMNKQVFVKWHWNRSTLGLRLTKYALSCINIFMQKLKGCHGLIISSAWVRLFAVTKECTFIANHTVSKPWLQSWWKC